MLVVLAGCGRGGGAAWQTLSRDGFGFQAPAGWVVTETSSEIAASSGRIKRVQVQRFRLVKAYRPPLFAAAARELDRVTAEVARELHGHVAAAATIPVAKIDARSYRIAYGKLVEEITFVLADREEYELLCRRAASAADDVCSRFVRSFVLTG